MPSNLIKSFAKKSGTSVAKVEQYWDEAKKLVEKKYTDIPKDSDRYFALIVSIVKNMIGITDKVETINKPIITTIDGIIREAVKTAMINPFKEKINVIFINKDDFIKVINSTTKSTVDEIKRNNDMSYYILINDGERHINEITSIQFIYGGYMRNSPIYSVEYIKRGLHKLNFNNKVIMK